MITKLLLLCGLVLAAWCDCRGCWETIRLAEYGQAYRTHTFGFPYPPTPGR